MLLQHPMCHLQCSSGDLRVDHHVPPVTEHPELFAPFKAMYVELEPDLYTTNLRGRAPPPPQLDVAPGLPTGFELE